MEAPGNELYEYVVAETARIRAPEAQDAEVRLDALLGSIESAFKSAVESAGLPIVESAGLPVDEAEDLLAATESWAALVSSAVARVYAPASPWPVRLAAWSKTIAMRLRAIANRLGAVMAKVAKALKAVSFSVAIAFPWGISIGLSF